MQVSFHINALVIVLTVYRLVKVQHKIHIPFLLQYLSRKVVVEPCGYQCRYNIAFIGWGITTGYPFGCFGGGRTTPMATGII